MANPTFIHPLADVDERATISPEGVRIYAFTRIGPNAVIGANTTIGCGAEVDGIVGRHCKIQGGARIYHGVTLEEFVFIGPAAVTTNDIMPNASGDDWSHRFRETLIKAGAAIGANATIVCGITIGEHSVVGAGSVVCHDVKPWHLVRGNPAQHIRQFIKPIEATLEVTP